MQVKLPCVRRQPGPSLVDGRARDPGRRCPWRGARCTVGGPRRAVGAVRRPAALTGWWP